MNSISFFKTLLMKELNEKDLPGNQEKIAQAAEPKDKITAADFAALRAKKDVKKEGEDHEVSMAQNSLKSIISSASQLMNMLGQDEKDIPAWIQDHITNAENYINQASKNYHEYHNGGDMDELPVGDEEVYVEGQDNYDVLTGGLPHKIRTFTDEETGYEYEQIIITEPIPDDPKSDLVKKFRDAGWRANPNMGGGITATRETGRVIDSIAEAEFISLKDFLSVLKQFPENASKEKVVTAYNKLDAADQPEALKLASGKDVLPSPKKTNEISLQSMMEDLFEAKKKPSAGLSKKQKSAIVKKAKSGKDMGKKGKGFEKIVKAAKKSGADNPEAVAGAAFWKGQAKKAK